MPQYLRSDVVIIVAYLINRLLSILLGRVIPVTCFFLGKETFVLQPRACLELFSYS
jgi:hypothetical protein